EILAQAEEMLGNTDVKRSRALKQALLSEARQGGEKPREGKGKAGKGSSRAAPFGADGQDPAGKARPAKAAGDKSKKAKPTAKASKPGKHRKGPPKPKAAGSGKNKVKS
ncbi:ribonuclease R, partial [Metapseudomonas otitidis]